MRSDAVDEYVRTRLPDEHHEVMAALRDLMEDAAPGVSETITYGSPAWRGKRKVIAIISVSKTHLTFAFAQGARFTDDHGLLKGTGKTTRHLKLKTMDDVNHDALRGYIWQAVELEES